MTEAQMLNREGAPVLLTEVIERRILLVTINRPEVRNCISGAVAAGIDAAVKRLETEEDLWVGILTGAGQKAFCAGADLGEIAAGRRPLLSTSDGGFAGFVQHPRKKPWIAAVRGLAMGGGMEIALACDMIVAGTNARFALPEVRRGLVASAGGMIRLPRIIPRNIAMEMLATGEPIGAQRAFALGLVNRVVSDEELSDEAVRLARSIIANAPLAVRASLEIARLSATGVPEESLWPESSAARDEVMASLDAKEGPRAFLEKRDARWLGR